MQQKNSVLQYMIKIRLEYAVQHLDKNITDLWLSSTWLKNVTNDLSTFDMRVLEARNVTQNRCSSRLL